APTCTSSLSLHDALPILADGNSVVLVDHDVQLLSEVDHLLEIGPGSGREGGQVVAAGTVAQVAASPATRLGGFLDGREEATQPRSEEHTSELQSRFDIVC